MLTAVPWIRLKACELNISLFAWTLTKGTLITQSTGASSGSFCHAVSPKIIYLGTFVYFPLLRSWPGTLSLGREGIFRNEHDSEFQNHWRMSQGKLKVNSLSKIREKLGYHWKGFFTRFHSVAWISNSFKREVIFFGILWNCNANFRKYYLHFERTWILPKTVECLRTKNFMGCNLTRLP